MGLGCGRITHGRHGSLAWETRVQRAGRHHTTTPCSDPDLPGPVNSVARSGELRYEQCSNTPSCLLRCTFLQRLTQAY